MQRKPLGVWFSLALGIFFAALILGFLASERVAPYWVRRQIRSKSPLPPAAQTNLEHELGELFVLEDSSCVLQISNLTGRDNRADFMRATSGIESIALQGKVAALTPVAQFDSGFAHLAIAVEDRRVGDDAAATRETKAAQAIFRALGWLDVTPETLNEATKRRPCHHEEIAIRRENRR